MRDRQATVDVRKAQKNSAIGTKKMPTLGGLGEIKQEFKRISWTNKVELLAYTKIVVGATFVVGLGIYVIDLFVRGTLSGLSGLVRAVTG